MELEKISDSPPEDIEYTMKEVTGMHPVMWSSDSKLGGKKRNKAKSKAQRKARKISRRK